MCFNCRLWYHRSHIVHQHQCKFYRKHRSQGPDPEPQSPWAHEMPGKPGHVPKGALQTLQMVWALLTNLHGYQAGDVTIAAVPHFELSYSSLLEHQWLSPRSVVVAFITFFGISSTLNRAKTVVSEAFLLLLMSSLLPAAPRPQLPSPSLMEE